MKIIITSVLELEGTPEDLVEDLVQIIAVFSCKLQGKRAHTTKRMIKELIEDD